MTKMRTISPLLIMLAVCAPVFAQGTITHIISIKKENRSFDHYFGAYPGVQSICQGGNSPANSVCYAPNDSTAACTTGDICPQPTSIARKSGNPYPLLLEDANTIYADVDHARGSLVFQTHGGLMDKFSTAGCPNSGGSPTAAECGYAYFDRTQIGYYYSLADTYGLHDNFFSAMTPSAPATMMWFAGQNGGISDNPVTMTKGGFTCVAGPHIGATATHANDPIHCGSDTPTATHAYKSNWTCESTHTGSSYPFTYTGTESNSSGTLTSGSSGGLYCCKSGATHSCSATACTSNASCTNPAYPACLGTGFYGGVCADNAAVACTCFNGDGLSNGLGGSNPGSCPNTSACVSTCSTANSIGGNLGAPCPNLTTIADQLNAASVTWKYYTGDQNRNASAMFQNVRYSPQFAANNFPDSQFAADAAAALGWCSLDHATLCSLDSTCSHASKGTCVDNSSNALPTVVFLGGTGSTDEHPTNSVAAGVAWTQTQLNAVFSNPYLYNHSIVFLTWDDSGGFYDHVPPPWSDGLNMGMRVPLLCVGPYCVHGINHLQMEFASVLKCIEQFTGASSIGSRDTIANDACFGAGTKSNPGTGANAGMIDLSQPPIPALAEP
jgi:phospholipase C